MTLDLSHAAAVALAAHVAMLLWATTLAPIVA